MLRGLEGLVVVVVVWKDRGGGGVPGMSGHCLGSQIVFRMEFV